MAGISRRENKIIAETMLLVALVAIVLTAPLAMGYDEKFDKIDVDKIVADDELFNSYIECFLDKGPCNAEHSDDMKKLIPEVIAEACEKCSTVQKVNLRKFVTALYEKKPNKAIEFHKKYDPTGVYEPKFAAFLIARDD